MRIQPPGSTKPGAQHLQESRGGSLAQGDWSMSADHRDCGAYFVPFLQGRLDLEDQLGRSRGSSRTPLMVGEHPWPSAETSRTIRLGTLTIVEA